MCVLKLVLSAEKKKKKKKKKKKNKKKHHVIDDVRESFQPSGTSLDSCQPVPLWISCSFHAGCMNHVQLRELERNGRRSYARSGGVGTIGSLTCHSLRGGQATWLLLGNILHFCILRLVEIPTQLLKVICFSPFNVNQGNGFLMRLRMRWRL